MRKRVAFISCIIFLLVFCIPASATTSQGYYDREDEDNNTIGNADVITSERVMQGRFDTTGDNDDYYSLGYVSSGTTIDIQLSSIPSGCDYDLYLCDNSGTIVSSINASDLGEWISTTVTTSKMYYIRVYRSSGSNSNTYYRLYTQVGGQKFSQSFYICQANSDNYMYYLGRDHTNNLSGLVFLDFGIPQKNAGVYGVYDLNGNYASLSRVKTAVDKFIQGYNANPKHNQYITIFVSINNKSGGLYPLSSSTLAYSDHGSAFKTMVESIATSGYVNNIDAGIDAEMLYNTPSLTRAWVDGFTNAGSYKRLYNFGDHSGRSDDFSAETDPSFDNGWKASDIHYISYGNLCSFCVPEIYSDGNAKQWAYQKKWRYIDYAGVMSTNGWGGLLGNQDSYNKFYNYMQSNGVGQSLTSKTWIALMPPAQPN